MADPWLPAQRRGITRQGEDQGSGGGRYLRGSRSGDLILTPVRRRREQHHNADQAGRVDQQL